MKSDCSVLIPAPNSFGATLLRLVWNQRDAFIAYTNCENHYNTQKIQNLAKRHVFPKMTGNKCIRKKAISR